MLDRSTDVALIRPPGDAPGIAPEEVDVEPPVFCLPADHPLAGC